MDHDNIFSDLGLWAGTETSLLTAISGLRRMDMAIAAGTIKADIGSGGSDEKPYLATVSNGVGIVRVTGSLINRDSPYARYFGMTTYPDIQRAFVYLAEDPSVQTIVMDSDSGGGSVAGVEDTGNLITQIDKIKPVYAFTGGVMASAMYWLAASARKIYNTSTAMGGSIGVIATHMEYSKALADAGVGVTVIRAGKYKALVNPVEKLTEEAKAQAQASIDATYSVFRDHVAKQRGVTSDFAEKVMAQGREFIGQAMVDAKLTDGIKTYPQVMALASKETLDRSKRQGQNHLNLQGTTNMPGRNLSTEALAAIAAAGGTPPSDPAAPAAAAPAASADPAAAPAPAAAAPDAAPAAAAPDAAPAAAAAPAATAPEGSLVAYLQAELSKTQASLTSLTAELALAKEKSATPVAHAGLMSIVAASLSNMDVALRRNKADYSGMSADQLVEAHTKSAEAVKAAFPVNGISAVAPADTGSKNAKDGGLTLGHAKATSIR